MSIEKRLATALENEQRRQSEQRAARLSSINERFDRLVSCGAVQPERYKIAPINPISLNSAYTFS